MSDAGYGQIATADQLAERVVCIHSPRPKATGYTLSKRYLILRIVELAYVHRRCLLLIILTTGARSDALVNSNPLQTDILL
jgi:hypothetical protein